MPMTNADRLAAQSANATRHLLRLRETEPLTDETMRMITVTEDYMKLLHWEMSVEVARLEAAASAPPE